MTTIGCRALFIGPLLVPGCITININFPAKQVERAAEIIVEEARPEENGNGTEGAPPSSGPEDPAVPPPPRAGETPPPETRVPPPEPKKDGGESRAERRRGGGRSLLVSFTPHAGAEEPKQGKSDIEIDINTPIIREIRRSLKQRFPKLLPHYEQGAIGESREGFLETRDDSKLSLSGKRDLKALVEAENRDRRSLYQEIVRANKFDNSRLKDVQRIFAEEWISRSRTGWWIQTAKGEWVKKPPPEKKKT